MNNLYINDEGEGFPVLFVHGFLGSSEMWHPQIDFFKKYFRVITLDLPGFGKSMHIKSHKNIISLAKLILECLKEKQIEEFHLLGHSMGGMIAQEMAKIIGNKISKLICYSTGPLGQMPDRFETIEESRNKLRNNGLKITAKNIAKTWFVLGERAKHFDICIQSGKKTTIEAADNALIAMKDYNGINTLNLIKHETLIIWGDKDRSYNFSQSQLLKENITNSSLTIFKGCSHNVHLEKIQEFNSIVLNFLTNNVKLSKKNS